MPRSNSRKRLTVIASNIGIRKAEGALSRHGFESKTKFAAANLISRSAVTKFFNRQGIQLDTFQRICDGLKLSWDEILDCEVSADIIEQKVFEQQKAVEKISTTPSHSLETMAVVKQQITVLDSQQNVKAVILLEGDIASVDANLKTTLEVLLQSYGGNTIKITNIEAGSIIITLQGSQEDIEQLRNQIALGRLSQLHDFPIRFIEVLDEELLNIAKEENKLTKWELVQAIIASPQDHHNLSEADLSNVDLSNADLRNADLRNADLSNADLSNADLNEVNLSTAIVHNTQFGEDVRLSDIEKQNLTDSGALFGDGPRLRSVYEWSIDKEPVAQSGALNLKQALSEKITTKKILLIEENESICSMLQQNLTEEGYEVVLSTGGGDEGILLAVTESPDLILIDTDLPVIDGWQAIKILKVSTITQKIPVIVLITSTKDIEEKRVLEIDYDDYELKPIDFASISDKIKALLGSSTVPPSFNIQEELTEANNASLQELPEPGNIALSKPLVVYVCSAPADGQAMEEIVRSAGYSYEDIIEPSDVLPLLLENRPNIIFLDLVMPFTNGYEMCAQIRRITTFRETPIIIMTNNDGIIDRVRARLVGASGFFSKPVREQRVLKVLQKYINPPSNNPLNRFQRTLGMLKDTWSN